MQPSSPHARSGRLPAGESQRATKKGVGSRHQEQPAPQPSRAFRPAPRRGVGRRDENGATKKGGGLGDTSPKRVRARGPLAPQAREKRRMLCGHLQRQAERPARAAGPTIGQQSVLQNLRRQPLGEFGFPRQSLRDNFVEVVVLGHPAELLADLLRGGNDGRRIAWHAAATSGRPCPCRQRASRRRSRPARNNPWSSRN